MTDVTLSYSPYFTLRLSKFHFHSEAPPDLFLTLVLDRGFNTSDDLLLADPSLEDLTDYGFVDEGDRMKVFYELHPEDKPYEGNLISCFLEHLLLTLF